MGKQSRSVALIIVSTCAVAVLLAMRMVSSPPGRPVYAQPAAGNNADSRSEFALLGPNRGSDNRPLQDPPNPSLEVVA